MAYENVSLDANVRMEHELSPTGICIALTESQLNAVQVVAADLRRVPAA